MKVIVIWPDEDLPFIKVLVKPPSQKRDEIRQALRNSKAMLEAKGFSFYYGWKLNLTKTYFETVAVKDRETK